MDAGGEFRGRHTYLAGKLGRRQVLLPWRTPDLTLSHRATKLGQYGKLVLLRGFVPPCEPIRVLSVFISVHLRLNPVASSQLSVPSLQLRLPRRGAPRSCLICVHPRSSAVEYRLSVVGETGVRGRGSGVSDRLRPAAVRPPSSVLRAAKPQCLVFLASIFNEDRVSPGQERT